MCLAALRSEIAENCSSTSAKRTALRRLFTICSKDRETMSSSLPSMVSRPVTASLGKAVDERIGDAIAGLLHQVFFDLNDVRFVGAHLTGEAVFGEVLGKELVVPLLHRTDR